MVIETMAVIKEVKPATFLYFRSETTVDQLANYIPVARELFREAIDRDLPITGPIHWHYFGFSGDSRKPFTLEVALPVAAVIPEYDGSFHFKRTEPFLCASLVHEGAWNELPTAYEKLMKFISENNQMPSWINREIYVNADFENPTANVTEVQAGIQRQ